MFFIDPDNIAWKGVLDQRFFIKYHRWSHMSNNTTHYTQSFILSINMVWIVFQLLRQNLHTQNCNFNFQ